MITKEYKMIRICVMPLTILCCVMLNTFISHGQTYTCGDYEYERSVNGNAKIVNYTGKGTDVLYIPDTLDGYNVTVLDIKADFNYFKWNSSEIHLPDSMTTIRAHSFDNDNTIERIYISKNVLTIDDSFFLSSLTDIYVDEENKAFCDVDGVLYSKDKKELYKYPEAKELTEYTIIDTVKNIGYTAFRSCENLQSITIPLGVRTIGMDAFADCSALTEVTIPPTVERLEPYSFSHCTNMTSLTLGENVEYIGIRAFERCGKLKTVTIPKNVSEIGKSIFGDCTLLEAIEVDADNKYFCSVDGVLYSKNMKRLYQYPSGKTDKNYIIPDGLEVIMESAVENNQYITRIEIPQSVTDIMEGEFYFCDELEEIDVDYDNPYYCDIDGVLFSRKQNKLLCYPSEKKGSDYIVPKGVQVIGEHAFFSTRVNNLIIPEGVKEIHTAFLVGSPYLNYKMESLVLPRSLDYMDQYIMQNIVTNTIYVEKDSYAEQYLSDSSRTYQYTTYDNILKLSDEAELLLCDSVVHDKDFLNILEEFDSNKDHSLSRKERSSITELIADNKDISDMTGIEYLDELRVLDCHNNRIKELDISNNKKLSTLYCWNNSFEEVDVSAFSDNDDVRLKYNFTYVSETENYENAYKDYKLWGGSVKYDNENKKLVYKAAAKQEETKVEDAATEQSTDGEQREDEQTSENVVEDKYEKQSDDKKSEGGQKTGEIGSDESGKKEENNNVSKERTIIFAKSYSKKYGDKQFDLNAQTNSNAALEYSSSNRKVCKVSSKGKVTIKGCGKTNITIKAPETSAYEAGSLSVTIKVLPGKVILKSVKSPKKSQINFSWEKMPGVTKYQYNISKKKNFKGAKLYTTKNVYKKIKPSSDKSNVSGFGFYIRVRAVSKIGKKTYYGKWSKVQYIRVK